MNIIANTDLSWFDALKCISSKNIVNFWTPNPWRLNRILMGEKIFFHLKNPIRKIGGYGLLAEQSEMTIASAWDLYGNMNGCENLSNFIEKIDHYSFKNTGRHAAQNKIIGCLILRDLVFFQKKDYKSPEHYGTDFKKNIVTFKYLNN